MSYPMLLNSLPSSAVRCPSASISVSLWALSPPKPSSLLDSQVSAFHPSFFSSLYSKDCFRGLLNLKKKTCCVLSYSRLEALPSTQCILSFVEIEILDNLGIHSSSAFPIIIKTFSAKVSVSSAVPNHLFLLVFCGSLLSPLLAVSPFKQPRLLNSGI